MKRGDSERFMPVLVLVMLLLVGVVLLVPGDDGVKSPTVSAGDLPVVGSRDNFVKLVAQWRENEWQGRHGGAFVDDFFFSEQVFMMSDDAMAGFEAIPAESAGSAARTATEGSPAGSEVRVAGEADTGSEAGGVAGEADYSETNVQVAGVDEADIVKTDGEFIFYVNNNRIIVAKAFPPGQMAVVDEITYEGDTFRPREVYLDSKHLIVIGERMMDIPIVYDNHGRNGENGPEGENEPDRENRPEGANGLDGENEPEGANGHSPVQQEYQEYPEYPEYMEEYESRMPPDIMIYPPPDYRHGTVSILVYDAADRKNISLLREVDLEGYYVSSRKIGDALYFVANKHLDYYIMDNLTSRDGLSGVDSIPYAGNYTPSYRDTAVSSEFIPLGFQEVRYFPDFSEPHYLLVGGINLQRLNEQVEIYSYLGSGENVYSSPDNMYVAVTNYDYGTNHHTFTHNTSTTVYRFALDDGRMEFSGKGQVPGVILNQFSMDEYQGHFRIATTTGEMWRTDEGTSRNNMYILGQAMDVIGKVEGIAPGESIYAVRYMGDRGYMVTFRTVDPLFVIDLKDPAAPRILGELKIPGYSDYLHPYDENHLLGFGKEAVEIITKDHLGNPVTMALEQGLKMALFDVSDVHNPVEKFNVEIGGRGSDSELLRNHRALLFDREKNILAFPVTLYGEQQPHHEMRTGDDWIISPGYSGLTFQGAVIYGLDLEKGFQLRGKISHLSPADYRENAREYYYRYDYDKFLERILYIGDVFYTFSGGEIRASRMDTLKTIKSLYIQ